MPHRTRLAAKNNATRTNQQQRSGQRDGPRRRDACGYRSTLHGKVRGLSARSIPSRTRPAWSSTKTRNYRGERVASARDFFRALRVLLSLSSSKAKGKEEGDSQEEEVKEVIVEAKTPSALDVSGRAFGKELQAELARIREGPKFNPDRSPSLSGCRQEGLSLQQLAQLRSHKPGRGCYTPSKPPSTWWENGSAKRSLSPSSSTSTLPISPLPSPPPSSWSQLPPVHR